jgi:epoxyqueuosine reductase
MPDHGELVAIVRTRAQRLGFSHFGITSATADHSEQLSNALDRGWLDGMDWMADTKTRRASPVALWPDARSVIMVGLNYGPDENPMAMLEHDEIGVISVYARHRDYHDLIKGRLKEMAGLLVRRAENEKDPQVKVFVDTAPLMEKPLAGAAGLGWQGKNTVLVSRQGGTWLFLGAILTNLELPFDEPAADTCGSCTKCLDICPTDAFAAPYRLDARRCIAYLTNEHEGPIPVEFRVPMGNRIYGCDDCLAVCPWNKFAMATTEAKLAARADLNAPPLSELADLDEKGFRARFAGSPVKRIGRARFLRNVLIAIGNSKSVETRPAIDAALGDPAPLVRGAAVWALGQRGTHADIRKARARWLPAEKDCNVLDEWHRWAHIGEN